mgnify:CR=1 FL=1
MPNEKTIPKLTINEIDSLEVWEYLKNNNLISDDELYLINAEGILSIFLKGKEYTDEQITSLINSAPETLDTLGELALAFEENKDVVAAIDSAITKKANITDLEAIQNTVNTNTINITTLQSQILPDTLIISDAITGSLHAIQVQNGQLVSMPIEELEVSE